MPLVVPPPVEPEPPQEPAWLDESELSDWFRISALALTLPAALDGQLKRDSQMSLFSYLIMAMLSEAPEMTLQMSQLAVLTHGSLPRLSHAVAVLERRGCVRRQVVPGRPRYTVAILTAEGLVTLRAAAPGHVRAVRAAVLDPLTVRQRHDMAVASVAVLRAIGAPDPWPEQWPRPESEPEDDPPQ